MAPSQMEHQQEQSLGQGYTHKKFNCGYQHKKLGMRLRQREDINNKENIANNSPQNQEITKRSKPSSKGLFRPYALGNDTPRKRKISRDSESSSDEEMSQQHQYIASPSTSPVAYYQQQEPASPVATTTCPSPALSPNSYALRLQRQRAALYMRYMQQFHSSGNMPTSQAAAPPTTAYQAMGYPNVTAPIFNGC